MEVTISRLPDSDLYDLEDYLDQQDLDPDHMRVFKSLLMGYGAAWDTLEQMKNIEEYGGDFNGE